MKKFLLIMANYYPNASANTACTQPLVEYLTHLGHQVDVLSFTGDINNYIPLETINGIRSFKALFNNNRFSKLSKKFNVAHWSKLPFIIKSPISLYFKIKHAFKIKTADEFDFLYYRKLKKLLKKHNKENYDYIFSSSMPFAANVLARNLVKDKLAKRWSNISLDSYECHVFWQKNRIKQKIKTANKVFDSAEKVFAIPGIYEEMKNQNYVPKYLNKLVNINIPALVPKQNLPYEDEIICNISFAGNFYTNLRNPSTFLEVLSKLDSSFKLNICGQGCEEIFLEKEKLFTNCKLNYLKYLPYEDSIKLLAKSNILINIGNNNTAQVPSKSYEIMGFGKPILNFYYKEDDFCLELYKNYPIVFNFNLLSYSEEDVTNLIAFCNKYKNTILSYEEATKNLKEHVADNICKFIMSNVTI